MNKEYKKALLVNSSYYPEVGGVENSLRSISTTLVSSGWSVDVISSNNEKANSRENLFGANVYRYAKKHPLSYIYSSISLMRKLKKNNYDLIICRHHTLVLLLRLCGFNNVNYIVPGVYKFQNICDLNTKKLKYFIRYYFNCFTQYLSFKYSNLYVFSNTMEEQILKVAKIKPEIGYLKPGVDSNRFYSASEREKIKIRSDFKLPRDKKIILGIGRFVDVKNFEMLILSMKSLPNDFLLVLVGDGINKKNYINLIEENSLSEKVVIHSATNTPEQYYKSADLFCLPSTYEPFGQVLLEASFTELPIVAFDSSECDMVDTASTEIYEYYPELIKLTKYLSAESLASSILEMSNEIINKNMFDDFKSNHTWDKLVSLILGDQNES